jgi:hypothetical protein
MKVKSFFNAGAGDYSGHHRARMAGAQRKFEINIAVPRINVCKGVLSFNLLRGVSLGGGLDPSGQVSTSSLPKSN